ncbi:MAG: hypothetical protein FD157_3581 [Rhodocyclaceae bacterium]|nr:MAG: hypothetical protein FD157_3581 [Rhodocyclaceae bacterium]TND00623.1 MAG: hypothetical protein FD118_2993 [Rhodocyclaceae bacterium]
MTEKDAATLAKLIAGCREQMESDLCELVEELGPELVQVVTARTYPAREPERRMAAATLKLALSAHWGKVAPALKAALAGRSFKAARPGIGSQEPAKLQLLSKAAESIQIASNQILDRLTTACREETNPLERRITYLVLRSAMTPGDASFKLASLWACIEAACGEVTDDTAARITLLQLVGEHLAPELPQLYRVVNETLIDAEILPRLKRSYREMALVDPHEVAAESARMASALDRLVKARTKDGEAATNGSGSGSLELFDSMKTLQAAPAPANPDTHTNIVRMARDSGAARGVRLQEAVSLDIVAELFDQIFNDPNVANGMKGLVARLQSTVLKAAMLNQRFFADRSHPARRFLDSISTVAIRWGKVVNIDDPFFVKLLELVNKVQATYDGDMAVFDAANAELDAFLAEREKIEEQQDRELADAVHAREEEIRLTRVAQMRAQRAANHCIELLLGPMVPTQIEEFLRSYWRDVVQGRISQAGEDGAPTKEALGTAVSLIWAVRPKHDPGERKRHAAALPGLLKKLNAGFDEIGAAPTERKTFMDTLVDLQIAALRAEKQERPADKAKPAPAPEEKPRARSAGPTLQVSHATKSGVRVQDISLPGAGELDAESTPDRADLRRVRQLVRGDWIDFITAGQSRRERLTWINTSRTLFLFSNSASECAISITPEALAVRLRNKTASIVTPDRPMFERAIHGAIHSLDKRA